MIAAFQRVPPATLDELVRAPALLEDYLFGEDDDSYTFDGYGDLSVDVSKARMGAWTEIHRRVQGLGGEMRLTNGTVVAVKAVEIERDVTRWRHPETGAVFSLSPPSENLRAAALELGSTDAGDLGGNPVADDGGVLAREGRRDLPASTVEVEKTVTAGAHRHRQGLGADRGSAALSRPR
jgi:hypothetical protein